MFIAMLSFLLGIVSIRVGFYFLCMFISGDMLTYSDW